MQHACICLLLPARLPPAPPPHLHVCCCLSVFPQTTQHHSMCTVQRHIPPQQHVPAGRVSTHNADRHAVARQGEQGGPVSTAACTWGGVERYMTAGDKNRLRIWQDAGACQLEVRGGGLCLQQAEKVERGREGKQV